MWSDVVRFDLGPLLQGQTTIAKLKSAGPVFTKGLRLSQVLGLNPVLNLRLFVSAKFCLNTVFTKGELAKSKIIK